MRSIKRILKIQKIDGYKVFCLFNNGVSRIIDFEKVFEEWEVKKGDIEYPLTKSLEAFQGVSLIDGTLTWENIEIASTDEDGNAVVYPYDLDPIVLYQLSEENPTIQKNIGLMIKLVRKEQGLTQQELAQRSGTSKHYISKIENNKSGIELATLTKIIEVGLGKSLQINIL